MRNYRYMNNIFLQDGLGFYNTLSGNIVQDVVFDPDIYIIKLTVKTSTAMRKNRNNLYIVNDKNQTTNKPTKQTSFFI